MDVYTGKLCLLLTDLLYLCAGFGAVVHYDDEPVSQEVKGWNVTFFKVKHSPMCHVKPV
jgi:hypothetical protein